MLWQLQGSTDARTPSPTLQALQGREEEGIICPRHACAYSATTV